MNQLLRPWSAMHGFALAIVLAMTACAPPPHGDAPATGKQLAIKGRVVTVDTDPWAYDANAVVIVETDAGRVAVQLPARWNLCKAQPPDNVQALKPGDRVQAVGTSTAPGEVVVCEQPQHLLRRLD